jgi:tRNA threonylcarbamoyladenosine biosynthesis protein TsaB
MWSERETINLIGSGLVLEGVSVSPVAEPRLLVLETSGRVGQVALAEGRQVRAARRLDEARRHARDLVPAVRDLLADLSWQPRDLAGVIVSRGPGSYTGLRVGIMSAKALTYATDCALLAIETFSAIAQQAAEEVIRVDVLADAQQDKIYVQRFGRRAPGEHQSPESPLHIEPFSAWLAQREKEVWVSGPGLRGREGRLPPETRVVDAAFWEARPESLLALGVSRYLQGERDDVWTVEPLYLRPSSAEEKLRGAGF